MKTLDMMKQRLCLPSFLPLETPAKKLVVTSLRWKYKGRSRCSNGHLRSKPILEMNAKVTRVGGWMLISSLSVLCIIRKKNNFSEQVLSSWFSGVAGAGRGGLCCGR